LPETSREFLVQAGQKDVWNVISNPLRLSKCIPGCEKVTVLDEAQSLWKVKLSVGIVTRAIEARVKVTGKTEPSELNLQLNEKNGDFNAEFFIELLKENETKTRVKFKANIESSGSFAWVVNRIISTQMDKFVSDFVNRLQEATASPASS